MRRTLFAGFLLLAGIFCLNPADAFWQSRDSNYNANFVSGGGGSLACSYTPVTTATENTAYTGATPSASGGTPAYTFSNTGSLPTGLSINSGTGIISGTPTVAGTFAGIQVQVTDTIPNTANCGTSFTLTVAYQGPGDLSLTASATDWYGLRAYNNTLANAGATTTPVIDVFGSSTGSCTIYLLGDGTGGLDFSTAGAGAVGHQCLLGATTFCTVTNTSCVVSKIYDQVTTNHATQGTSAKRPTLTFSCLGSLPCLTFAAGNSQTLSGTTASHQYGNLVAVANRNPTSSSRMDVMGFGTGLSFNSATSQSALFQLGTALTLTGVTDASWHVLGGMFGTTSGTLYTDSATSTGTVTIGSSQTTFSIGSNAAGASNFLTGTFFEGGWNAGTTSLTTANLTSYCTNAKTYWGFSVSC